MAPGPRAVLSALALAACLSIPAASADEGALGQPVPAANPTSTATAATVAAESRTQARSHPETQSAEASSSGEPASLEGPSRAEVERLIREHAIETRISRPSPWSYPGELASRLLEALSSALARRLSGARWLGDGLIWISYAILALALIAATAAVAKAVARARSRRAGPDPVDGGSSAFEPELMAARDREATLLALLADGRAEEALGALWWWLAEALHVHDADASWTMRELVQRQNRLDLSAPVRTFDRLAYGGVDRADRRTGRPARDPFPRGQGGRDPEVPSAQRSEDVGRRGQRVDAVRRLYLELRERLDAAAGAGPPAGSGGERPLRNGETGKTRQTWAT